MCKIIRLVFATTYTKMKRKLFSSVTNLPHSFSVSISDTQFNNPAILDIISGKKKKAYLQSTTVEYSEIFFSILSTWLAFTTLAE